MTLRNRRGFLAAASTMACTCAAGSWAGAALAQNADAQPEWKAPERFLRPDIATDEGGLWAMMDREETRLRRSPFSLRDPRLRDYIQDMACRLGSGHCPDVRVHLVRTPLFNASMAPNGMMQIWTGLLLRVDNEAQLAAVIGHEIGHYMQRHSVERLRDAKSRSAFGTFLSLFGVVGALGQLAVLAGAFAYSRDHEREADRIGLTLMHEAGYDTAEAAKVWGNLLLEAKARPGADPSRSSPMFATHPSPDERKDTLGKLAAALPGGVTNEDAWQARTATFRREWLQDEIKRGQHEESIALLSRMMTRAPMRADCLYARGEVQRLRAKNEDLDAATADFTAAIAHGGEPPETHRSLGLIQRARSRTEEAKASLARYLELAPEAPDFPMIKSYLEELRS